MCLYRNRERTSPKICCFTVWHVKTNRYPYFQLLHTKGRSIPYVLVLLTVPFPAWLCGRGSRRGHMLIFHLLNTHPTHNITQPAWFKLKCRPLCWGLAGISRWSLFCYSSLLRQRPQRIIIELPTNNSIFLQVPEHSLSASLELWTLLWGWLLTKYKSSAATERACSYGESIQEHRCLHLGRWMGMYKAGCHKEENVTPERALAAWRTHNHHQTPAVL